MAGRGKGGKGLGGTLNTSYAFNKAQNGKKHPPQQYVFFRCDFFCSYRIWLLRMQLQNLASLDFANYTLRKPNSILAKKNTQLKLHTIAESIIVQSVKSTVRFTQSSIFSSERPKPEFSAGTRTGTEIIPVRFRFGNSYRNRNGHFTSHRLPVREKVKDIDNMNELQYMVLVLYYTKIYDTECFHYILEKICCCF